MRSAFFVAMLLCATCAQAQATDPQNAAQEAAAKAKLDRVRAEMRDLVDVQRKTNAERGDAAAALREQELKLGATAKSLHELDQQIAQQQEKLGGLEKERGLLDAKLKDQRDALAALLRSAYAMGRGEELKLLLAQDRIDTVGRTLAYYRYFERARLGEIDSLLKDLDALAHVQNEIEKQSAELATTRERQVEESRKVDAQRLARQNAMDALDVELKDQKNRLAALGKDEKNLVDLIAKLRDIFADIPKQLAGAEPFAHAQGRLSWPLPGKIASGTAAHDEGDRAGAGVVIASKEGSDVHAVWHGRVVYADWLRGYGLLLIVDHGDGYLSLYGYNEALLKEVGDWVDAGETIATSGDSGGHRSPGVYFELRYQGKTIDPLPWLKPSSR